MRGFGPSPVALALGILSGCAQEEPGWNGIVTDSAGVTIVANPVEGSWDQGDHWTLEEELRIGSADGEADYVFGEISSITIDSEGSLFVLDAQADHVNVYDEAGGYVRTIGGPGSGPGEFSSQAITLYMGAGDTLLVPDIGNQRINRYSPDGTSVGSFPLDLSSLPMAINATKSGLLAAQLRPQFLPGQQVDSLDAIVVIGPEGTITDTLLTFPWGGTIGLGGVQIFSPEPIWCLMDGMRLCYGRNNDYSIDIYSDQGDLKRIIRKPFQPKPVTDQDQAMILSFIEENARNAGAPPAAVARLRSFVQFADYYPVFLAVRVGPDRTLWVQQVRSPPAIRGRAGSWATNWDFNHTIAAPEWDVFDREGRLLGQVVMPTRFVPHVLTEEVIYGVARGEFDEEYAVRLRVVRPGTG